MSPHRESTVNIAAILKTMGHPLRVSIIELLSEHEQLAVGEICGLLGTEQSLTSHHLNHLRLNMVVDANRQGKQVYYRIKHPEAKAIVMMLRGQEQR